MSNEKFKLKGEIYIQLHRQINKTIFKKRAIENFIIK